MRIESTLYRTAVIETLLGAAARYCAEHRVFAAPILYERCADDVQDLVHHSDRGTQYLSMRDTDSLVANGIGSDGDLYDNALAEAIIGLFKTEAIQRIGPCHHLIPHFA